MLRHQSAAAVSAADAEAEAPAQAAGDGWRLAPGDIPGLSTAREPTERAASASELAYQHGHGAPLGRPHDMELAADFDGVGGGNAIKNAFWKARYDGTTELFDAAITELARRLAARHGMTAIARDFSCGALRDLLWDIKKLHDNAAGRRHCDVDVALFRSVLLQLGCVTADEKAFIRSGLDALVAAGAPAKGGDHDEPAAEAPGSAPAESTSVSGAPVDIHYLSNTGDAVMTLERTITFGEVVGDSIPDMVEGILARAHGHPIGTLTITGHGYPGGQEVGEHGDIRVHMSAAERAQLARLRPHFAAGAEVVLGGCEVAAGPLGEQLLRELAELWGVRVRGGTPYQRLMPGVQGTEVVAEPRAGGGVQVTTIESPFNQAERSAPELHDDDQVVAVLDKLTDPVWARMTLPLRYDRAVVLLSGHTSRHEGDLLVKLFATASSSDRCELYRYLEGHPWSGDFHHGVLAHHDGLYDALTDDQAARLRALLND